MANNNDHGRFCINYYLVYLTTRYVDRSRKTNNGPGSLRIHCACFVQRYEAAIPYEISCPLAPSSLAIPLRFGNTLTIGPDGNVVAPRDSYVP